MAMADRDFPRWENDVRTQNYILPGAPQPMPGGPAGASPSVGPAPPPPPTPLSIPGFGNSQDLMRQIMMQILMPQLQKFFGGQAGWGPVAGSQTMGTPNPYPGGMGVPAAQQPLPNPAQYSQGPAGMMQGGMSWLAPFIISQFLQNMGSSSMSTLS